MFLTTVRGATTFSKLEGVQFLGLGYCTEQNTDGIPSFVYCSLLRNGNHTLHQKSWGGPSKFWGSRTPDPPVVAPLDHCQGRIPKEYKGIYILKIAVHFTSKGQDSKCDNRLNI